MTAFLVYTGGILAESFLNPWILEKVVKGLKFFKKIFTICSNGFHKICDIWWFEAECVEIARFCAEKPFDFM